MRNSVTSGGVGSNSRISFDLQNYEGAQANEAMLVVSLASKLDSTCYAELKIENVRKEDLLEMAKILTYLSSLYI